MADAIESQAALLAVLGNEVRLKVLIHISMEEFSVGALAEQLGLSQSALSQHLGKLRVAKLVAPRKSGQTVYYRVASDSVYKMLATLEAIFVKHSRD